MTFAATQKPPSQVSSFFIDRSQSSRLSVPAHVPWLLSLRGTEGSNPAPSSEESAANSVQVQREQGRRRRQPMPEADLCPTFRAKPVKAHYPALRSSMNNKRLAR